MDFVTAIWKNEISSRVGNIAAALNVLGVDGILLSMNVSLYYTSGRIFSGYTYISSDGAVKYFVRRPVALEGENVVYIRKPEQIASSLDKYPQSIAIELDGCTYNEALRLKNVFPEAKMANASSIMRAIRARKSSFEIERLRISGALHVQAYKHIPSMFRLGMTDIELQIAIEAKLRTMGSLGQFRIAGQSMELFMGNLLTGDNADTPSPYDFTMGGAGLDSSMPVGANGSEIHVGSAVMIDFGGNFTGYMTDMTRTFKLGHISDLAAKAHQASIDICAMVSAAARPGVMARELYQMALKKAQDEGLAEYFMGHRQQAGFIGHGVGIEVNEAPVLAPKSKDMIEQGNVIALEPKFVIPGVGAVGIENTYVVLADRTECITPAPEYLIDLQ